VRLLRALAAQARGESGAPNPEWPTLPPSLAPSLQAPNQAAAGGRDKGKDGDDGGLAKAFSTGRKRRASTRCL
jgi:hypothetical protein